MSELIRSFLAFDIENDDVRKRLSSAQTRLAQTGADVKLVETENIHVTMRFLGNVSIGMIEKIFEEMKKTEFKPFNVQIQGVGRVSKSQLPQSRLGRNN